MRKQIKYVALAAMIAMPASLFALDNNWYNPKTWFNKNNKVSSTTVTGNIESFKDQVIFKTLDGQTLLLIGNKAAKVGACGTEAKIRVFGNVYKPSDKYPAGALQVRNFRVLENAPSTASTATTSMPSAETNVSNPPATPIEPDPTPINQAKVLEEPTPEPYEEPSLESEPTTTNRIPNDIIVAEDQDDSSIEPYEAEDDEETITSDNEKTYVVQSGDTLGKISSKLFGTTAKWKKIAEVNNITNPKHLKVGMTLKVPND